MQENKETRTARASLSAAAAVAVADLAGRVQAESGRRWTAGPLAAEALRRVTECRDGNMTGAEAARPLWELARLLSDYAAPVGRFEPVACRLAWAVQELDYADEEATNGFVVAAESSLRTAARHLAEVTA